MVQGGRPDGADDAFSGLRAGRGQTLSRASLALAGQDDLSPALCPTRRTLVGAAVLVDDGSAAETGGQILLALQPRVLGRDDAQPWAGVVGGVDAEGTRGLEVHAADLAQVLDAALAQRRGQALARK